MIVATIADNPPKARGVRAGGPSGVVAAYGARPDCEGIMERMTPKERADAVEIVRLESNCAWGYPGAIDAWVAEVEAVSVRLHKLYEGACSRDLGSAGNASRDAEIERHETRLKEAFKLAGLGLYLNGDPRGNPVGILTPKTGRYNTMGGAECGWRI